MDWERESCSFHFWFWHIQLFVCPTRFNSVQFPLMFNTIHSYFMVLREFYKWVWWITPSSFQLSQCYLVEKKKVSLGSKMSMQSWIYHLSWQENLTKIDFFTIHLAGNIVKLSNFHHCKNRFRRGWNWRHAIHLRIFCSEKNCKLFTKVPRVKRTYAPHIRR